MDIYWNIEWTFVFGNVSHKWSTNKKSQITRRKVHYPLSLCLIFSNFVGLSHTRKAPHTQAATPPCHESRDTPPCHDKPVRAGNKVMEPHDARHQGHQGHMRRDGARLPCLTQSHLHHCTTLLGARNSTTYSNVEFVSSAPSGSLAFLHPLGINVCLLHPRTQSSYLL